MSTLVDHLRDHLIAQALVRAPNVPGVGARPWLPPAWRHPDGGAVGPGDAADQGKDATTHDDGLVLSILFAPGIPPAAGEEERRQDGVDLIFRATSVPAVTALDAAVRAELVGQYPGSRTDWTMAGLYVIQSRQWRALQPLDATDGTFTFLTGYLFETRA